MRENVNQKKGFITVIQPLVTLVIALILINKAEVTPKKYSKKDNKSPRIICATTKKISSHLHSIHIRYIKIRK